MQGIYNIVPTPFDESGAVDETSLVRLVDFVIDVSVATAKGRVPVVVGATAPATDPGVAYARDAVSRRAEGLLVAPPRLAQRGRGATPPRDARRGGGRAHRGAGFPGRLGRLPDPAFIGQLASDIPSCRYFKLEFDPTAQKVTAILEANLDTGVFGGLGGNFMLEELQRGAIGMMTGFGFPEIVVSIYRSFRAGDVEHARDTFYRYLPLIRCENQAGLNLPLRKLIYQKRGAIDHAAPRRPYPPLDATTLVELDVLRDHVGLTTPGPVSIDAAAWRASPRGLTQ